MEGKEYRDLKQNPEARDYRQYAATALRSARQYDGSERAFDELFHVLIDLEESIQTTPSLQQSDSQHREIEAAYAFAPRHPREIYDLLTVATESWQRMLHRAVEHPDEDHGIVVNKIEGVLLPPGIMERHDGSGVGGFEARFEPRIDEVLKILKTLRVFADDVIVTMGEVGKNHMREASYAGIDIPRLNRMILVCNQVGEATFVLSERVPVTDLLCVTKSDLPKEFPGTVTRIIRNGDWEREILSALGNVSTKEKMDVRALDCEQLRVAILKKYPTAENWVNAYRGERQGTRQGRVIEVLGRKLHFIAKRFEMSGTHISIAEFIGLSRKIYGENDEYLNAEARRLENGVEEWTRRIKEKYPDFSAWFAAYREGSGKEGGRKIEVDGRKLGFFGSLFGFDERPYSLPVFFRLSTMIYGEDDSDLVAAIDWYRERSPEEWKEEITSVYPTAKDFFDAFRAGRSEGGDMDIKGRGVQYFAVQFGVPTSRSRKTMAILLAEKLYGPEDSTVQFERLRSEERSEEEWKELILEQYPTSADWMAAYRGADGKNQGKDIVIGGRKIINLARELKIEALHYLSLEGCITLGLRVYGDADALLQKELLYVQGNSEAWKEEILKKYPTAEEWLKESYGTGGVRNAGAGVEVLGKGVNYLAARFGFSVPIRLQQFLELGIIIFGDDSRIRSELDRIQEKSADEWVVLIRKKYPTSREWIELFRGSNQGKAISIEDRGLHYIASRCGVKGDPRLMENFLSFTVKIYGEDDPYIRAEMSRLQERKDAK